MSVEVEGLLNARSKLIEELTAPDFSKKFGAVIGEAISPIIGAEMYSVLSRPE